MESLNLLENPRILIAYTTSNQEPFRSLEQRGALATWTKHFPAGCQIVSIQAQESSNFSILHSCSIAFEKLRWGKSGRFATILTRILGKPISLYRPKSELVDSSLILSIPEGLTFLGFKLLGSIDLMLQKDFDFLIYTNLSSYINAFRISEILVSVDPDLDFYAGKKLPSEVNAGISGSFIVLSRQTCKRVRDNYFRWNHAYLDDIALMRLMKKIKVMPTFLQSLEIRSNVEVRSIQREELLKYPHLKCGPQLSGSQRIDFLAMELLDEVLFPTSRNS